MKIKTFKMNGQGNDYLFFDIRNFTDVKVDWADVSRKWSDRHFGIGSDGVVVLDKDDESDAYMRIFNADGSEAEMCGTALRCTGRYLSDITDKNKITVNTLSGVKVCQVDKVRGTVTLDIGSPVLMLDNKVEVSVDNNSFIGYYISIGNPHFVVFDNQDLDDKISVYGREIETNSFFVDKTNVESVMIEDKGHISVKVWERGSGITLACGSGACVSAFLANRFYDMNKSIKVSLPGGDVNVIVNEDNSCSLEGEVSYVFETIIDV